MAEDLDKKSIEQLQKEKLQSEIDILHARLAKEYPDDDPPGFFDKIADFARKWTAFILGSVTLISAVFGVFVPLSEYLDESRRALQYDLNENMIGFVKDLNSDSTELANRGIMMLSYYEMNSIPILLFYLEGSQNNQKEFRLKIIETIDLIYADSKSSEIIEMVLVRLENNLGRLKIINRNGKERINADVLRYVYNYIELLNGLRLDNNDYKMVTEKFAEMKKLICTDDFLRDDIEVSGIFYEISEYLGEEATCK